jgi:hypothetical protein
MPIIAITTSSSISVNPLRRLISVLLLVELAVHIQNDSHCQKCTDFALPPPPYARTSCMRIGFTYIA